MTLPLNPLPYLHKDQLSIFYHKLKANADYTELSTIYGVGELLISKVFKNLVSVLFEFCSQYIWWLSKAENEKLMPKSFKKHFPNTRVILDATEIRTQIPKSVRSAVLKYSSYKNYHTLKVGFFVQIGNEIGQSESGGKIGDK